jgi:hypothetical protein
MTTRYFVKINERNYGPCTPEEMRRSSSITVDTLVYPEGEPLEWRRLHDVPELRAIYLPSAGPPPLPPSSKPMGQKWWVLEGKESRGPFDLEEFRNFVSNFGPETIVAPDGAPSHDAWRPTRTYDEFRGILAERSNISPSAGISRTARSYQNWRKLFVIGGASVWAVILLLVIIVAFPSRLDPRVGNASTILKKSMPSPSSFKLISSRVIWKGKNSEGKPAYVVRMTYDAQNAFGAVLRDCTLVSFWENGDTLQWNNLFGLSPCAFGGVVWDDRVVDGMGEQIAKLNFEKQRR